MKTKVLALLAVGLVGVTPQAHADPTTYYLHLTNGTNTLTGSITTDGTIGAIFGENILAWSFTTYGPAAFSMSTADITFMLCEGADGCFTATPTTLAFDFQSTTAALDPHALFLGPIPELQGLINFYNRHPQACAPAGCISVYSYTSPVSNFWLLDAPPDGVIGTVATSVPEPGTVALLGLGLAGLAALRRRKH